MRFRSARFRSARTFTTSRLTPGRGGQIARSAGQQATLSNREAGYALVKLPSGEIRRIHDDLLRDDRPGRQRRSHERCRAARPAALAGRAGARTCAAWS